jgi:autotransporter adhesin
MMLSGPFFFNGLSIDGFTTSRSYRNSGDAGETVARKLAAQASSGRARVKRGVSRVALATAVMLGAQPAFAQTTPAPNIVGACSGVSLPRSVVTDIVSPVVTGIVTPVQGTVNPILGIVGAALPLVPPLNIDAAGLLANAAAGNPITLQAVNANGTLVGPADRCDLQADSFTLRTPQGIAIGGNRITGLGTTGLEAVAGENNSIAFGNAAATDATATGSVAIGTGATVGAGATGALALGTGATSTGANGVALGAGSIAARGALAGYTATGLAAPQTSAGEVSVGAPGAERQITNVAAGSAATDVATVGQVAGVAAQVAALGSNTVQYGDATQTTITLGGAGGTTITNLAPGTVGAGSTDAVNGGQLYATNVQVTNNTAAITNLGNQVANGGTGTVQYSNAATPTTPNGGVPTNDLTLVGAAAIPVGLHNVAAGTIAPGSTDAVNGGQIYGLALTAANAVSYDTGADGTRANTVTLAGGNAVAPVTLRNVAPGAVAAGSTEAVNGGQLYSTTQAVATAQGTADAAMALGNNSVQYGAGRTSVTFNAGGTATVLSNVGAGVSPTDAANVGQLNAGLSSTLGSANAYTDGRIAALNFDVDRVRRQAFAGSSAAMAAAGLPQPYEAGKGMIAMGAGTYGGQSAVALGVLKAFNDGRTVMKLGGSYDSQGRVGASGGVGYQF